VARGPVGPAGDGAGIGLTIREATPGDGGVVAELLGEMGRPCTPAEAAARLGRREERVLLAEAGDRVVGLAALTIGTLLSHSRPLARVTSLVVRAAARRDGVGRRLMARAEEIATQAGCEGVELTSGLRPDREAAHRFYESLGYERTSYRFWRPLRGRG
jgi:ribosomal protein S18 acetylase RimI-like enzyme